MTTRLSKLVKLFLIFSIIPLQLFSLQEFLKKKLKFPKFIKNWKFPKFLKKYPKFPKFIKNWKFPKFLKKYPKVLKKFKTSQISQKISQISQKIENFQNFSRRFSISPLQLFSVQQFFTQNYKKNWSCLVIQSNGLKIMTHFRPKL